MIVPEIAPQGLSLGSMNWALGAADSVRPQCRDSESSPIAPAVLVPSRHGEPFRLDVTYPPHPRGTGDFWPNESIVSSEIGAGRCPIAAAWTARRLPGGLRWKWKSPEGDETLCDPIEVISEAIAQLVSNTRIAGPAAIAIPNNFRQVEQQRVLDACHERNADVALIWLPVAAALEWLAIFDDTLPSPTSLSDTSPPKLLICHCDWGHIEFTQLELVPWPDSSPTQWIPARSRPNDKDTHPGFGWDFAANYGQHTAKDVMDHWAEMFSNRYPIPSHVPNSAQGGRCEILWKLQGWDVPQATANDIQRQLMLRIKALGSRIAGLVVIGDWAMHLNLRELQNTPSNPFRIVQLAGREAESFVASGAARFRQAQLAKKTCYLDTLPELELFLEERGEFIWHPLLGEKFKYVAGGTPWHSDKPINVSVRRGEESVRLVVWHEEYEGVRELIAQLKHPAEQRLPGKLHVSATPAQGNAVIRIDFDKTESQPVQSITANWHRMPVMQGKDGKSLDRKSYLETLPRAYPELMPRQGSSRNWQKATQLMRRLSGGSEFNWEIIQSSTAYSIKELKNALLAKDQAAAKNSTTCKDFTAVGSDHRVILQPQLLEELTNSCLSYWRRFKDTHGLHVNDVVRILGYISASDPQFEGWLLRSLQNSNYDRSAISHACGHCLRSSDDLNAYFSAAFGQFRVSGTAEVKRDLKPVSQALRYRANATERLSSSHAELMVSQCLKVFKHQMDIRKGSTLDFRWSALVVGYLLRRRIYDGDFLPPDSDLALRAKKLFEEAIDRFEEGRLRPMGGSVNIIDAIQQLIDYIDKKGIGPLLLGAE